MTCFLLWGLVVCCLAMSLLWVVQYRTLNAGLVDAGWASLIALLAIVNPVGVLPFFIHFTQALSPAQRRQTIRVSAVAAGLVVAISALAGTKIIAFFGITTMGIILTGYIFNLLQAAGI